jgi:hypothetical protein
VPLVQNDQRNEASHFTWSGGGREVVNILEQEMTVTKILVVIICGAGDGIQDCWQAGQVLYH